GAMRRARAGAVVPGLAAASLLAATGRANADPPALRVVDVVTATSDAHDVAVLGDRTLVATSGGLVVVRGGRIERVLGAADGLPSTRLRSVSVTADGAVWAGGIEAAARLVAAPDGALRVDRTIPLARVRGVVSWRGAIWLG